MENILENNKLIAEFMDCENSQAWELIPSPYECDWDWLMEVVEKIESLKTPITNNPNLKGQFEEYEIYIQCKHVVIYAHGEITKEISDLKGVTKIQAVYNACIEFIKWYNKQKK